MLTSTLSSRRLKHNVLESLAAHDWESRWQEFAGLNPQKLVGPLFSALCSLNPSVKWHAVSWFGFLVPLIRRRHTESARIIMRRFLWSLNDESGGIGWGAPEAMGDIMACDHPLASEYHCLLLSFIEDRQGPDNYLEHLPLREGAYWGIARLAQSRPELVQPSADLLMQASEREESLMCRFLSFLALAQIPGARPGIPPGSDADQKLTIYWDRQFQTLNLKQILQGVLTPSPLNTEDNRL